MPCLYHVTLCKNGVSLLMEAISYVLVRGYEIYPKPSLLNTEQINSFEEQNSIMEGSEVWVCWSCSAFHNWAGVIWVLLYFIFCCSWSLIWVTVRPITSKWRLWNAWCGRNLPLSKNSSPRQTSCTFCNENAQFYSYSDSSYNLHSFFMRSR